MPSPTLINSNYSLYTSDEYAGATRSFFTSVDKGSLTSTLYQPPSTSIDSDFRRASGTVILNQGYLTKDSEVDLKGDKTRAYSSYASSLTSNGIKVSTYSTPESINRLHMKTYTGTIEGRDVGFVSTGNLSDSSLVAIKQKASSRMADNIINKVTFGNRGQDLYQLNLGLKITDKKEVADLRGIQTDIINKKAVSSRGNFLIGKDATTDLISSLSQAKAGSQIIVASPYIDDPNIINALVAAKSRNANVSLITSNPNSTVDRATGGNVKIRKGMVDRLTQSGVDVYMPDVNDPLLVHYKGAYISDGKNSVYYLGSHNLTTAAFSGESLDLLYKGTQGNLAEGIRRAFLSDVNNLGFIKKAGQVTYYSQGITNGQLEPYFDTSGQGVGLLLPSQHGTSYFFEKAIHNANRIKAGLPVSDMVSDDGFGASSYTMRYIANTGNAPDNIPEYIKNFDREMNTPGLSYYINMYSIVHGNGRIYKEENGVLGSLAGAIGAVLDKSLLQYSPHNADYLRQQQEIDPTGAYKEAPVGLFQGGFSFATNFAIQSTEVVLTYFLLGVPFGVVSAQLFHVSSQSLLDIALEQTEKNVSKIGLIKGAAIMATLGPAYLGKTTEELRGLLLSEGNEITKPFANKVTSVLGAANLFHNQRAGIFFDYAIRPFIEDAINPYNPRANTASYNKWRHLQEAMQEFRQQVTAPIYVVFEGEADKGKFILKNAGYEKNKAIAKSLDYLGSMLPANPFKWSWWGTNNANLTNTLKFNVVKGRVVERNFIALSEVFSFTDLLANLERIYYGGDYLRIVNKTTVVDETSIAGRIAAKSRSAIGLPLALLKRGTDILTAGISYVTGNDMVLGEIMTEHKRLRKLEGELIGKALFWNESKQMRELKGSQEDVERFIRGVLKYHDKVNPEKELEILQKASDFFAEQDHIITKVRNPYANINSNKFLRSKGALGIGAVAVIGISLALEDLFTNTGGASLMSQVVMALHHKEVGASVEFAPTQIFGWGGGVNSAFASLTWTAFSVAAGIGIGAVTEARNRELYHLSEETLEKVRIFANKQGLGGTKTQELVEKIVTVLGSKGVGGLIRPEGRFLRNFIIGTTVLLGARSVARFGVYSAANIIKSIPFLGEALFGKGEVKLNENFTLVSQLTTLRKVILNRIEKGMPVSQYEASAAYTLGVMTQGIPIIDPKQQEKNVEDVAMKSRLPYFQFLFVETLKGKQVDENNNVIKNGIQSFKVGMHSAPILGLNIAFSLPIDIDRDAKNSMGFQLINNTDKDNMLSYYHALGSIGASTFLMAATTIGSLEAVAGLVGMNIIPMLNRNNVLVEDLKNTANMTRTAFKTFYNGLEMLVGLPNYSLNFAKAIMKDRTEVFKSVLDTMGFRGHSSKIAASIMGRISRFAVGAFLGFSVFRFAAQIFTTDETIQKNVGWVGAVTGGLTLATSDKITSALKPIMARLGLSFKLSEKVPFFSKNKAALFVGAIMATASWLMTDSKFGVSEEMDTYRDSHNHIHSDWVKKLTVVGLYSGVTTGAMLAFADINNSPVDFIDNYRKYESKLALVRTKSSPLAYLQSQYYAFKQWSTKRYLNSYLDNTVKYMYQESINAVTAKDLSRAMAEDDLFKKAVDKLKIAKFNALEDLLDEAKHGNTVSRIWNREEFIKFNSGRAFNMKMTAALVTFTTTAMVASAIIHGVGAFFNPSLDGQRSVDKFYDLVDNLDGGHTHNTEIIGNLFRLLTFQDKKNIGSILDKNVLVDDTGKAIKRQGYRLIMLTDPKQNQLQKAMQDILAPFVIASHHPYQSILPDVGVTLRNGEQGMRFAAYAEEQSPLQNTSFSVYSALPNYLFKAAIQGKNEYSILVQEGLTKALKGRRITENSSEAYLAAASIATMTASAQMSPLQKRRKFSNPISIGTMSMLAGDNLLSMSLKERVRRTEELSYQRTTSILMRMSDPRDLSIMSTVNNAVDPKNPLAAYNVLHLTEHQDIGALTKGALGDLLRVIYGTQNRIVLTETNIKVDQTIKEVKVSSNQLEDSTSWKDESNVYVDTQQIQPLSPLDIAGRLLKLGDQGLNKFGLSNPIARLGVYAIGGLIGTTIAMGTISSFMLSSQSTRFIESRQILKNLFGAGLEEAAGYKAFYASPRVNGNGAWSANEFSIDSKGRKFTISIPEGADLNIKDINSALQSVMITIHNTNQELDRNLFSVPDVFKDWQGKTRIAAKEELSMMYNLFLNDYVEKVFNSFTQNVKGTPVGQLFSSKLQNIGDIEKYKNLVKTQIMEKVEEALIRELANGDVLGENLLQNFRGYAGDRAAKQLSYLILEELMPFITQIQKNLYFLETEDSLGYASRVSEEIFDMVDKAGGFVRGGHGFFHRAFNKPRIKSISLPEGGEVPAELLEDLDAFNREGRMTKGAIASKVGGNLLHSLAAILTFTDALDIFTSFNRLAATERDPYATEGDVNFNSEQVGQQTFNTGFMIVLSHLTFGKLFPKIGSSLANGRLKGKLGAILLGAAIVGGTAIATKDYIVEQWNKFSQLDWVRSLSTHSLDFIGNMYEGIAMGIGKGIVEVDKLVSKVPGFRRGAFTEMSAYGVAGASLAFGFAKKAITVTTMYALGNVIGGITQAIAPGLSGYLNKFLTPFFNGLSTNPFFGFFINKSDSPMELKANRYTTDTPIYMATASEAIANEVLKSLNEAADYTGTRTKELFSNPTLKGQGYDTKSPIVLLSQEMGKPTRTLIDPIIDMDMNIKAQYYNQTMVGAAVWSKMIYTADNYEQLKQMTYLQAIGQPISQMKHKAIEAQQKKDIQELQKTVKDKKNVSNSRVTALIAFIYKNNNPTVNKPNSEMKLSLAVSSKDATTSIKMKDKVNQYTTPDSSPILLFSVRANVSESGVVIENKIASKNDIALAVTQGKVNPLYSMPGYS